MPNRSQLSRRAIFGLAIAPVCIATKVTCGSSDAHLIALNTKLDAASAALEQEADHDAAMRLLRNIEAIGEEMVGVSANGIEGLRAKARATAWAIEHEFGMLDPANEATANDRIAASIVRDLLGHLS